MKCDARGLLPLLDDQFLEIFARLRVPTIPEKPARKKEKNKTKKVEMTLIGTEINTHARTHTHIGGSYSASS